PKLKDPEERARMTRVFQRGLGEPIGFVMPLKRQMWQARPTGGGSQQPPERKRPASKRSGATANESPTAPRWTSGRWPIRSRHMFLIPGDSPIGLRLPLDSLPWLPASQMPVPTPPDPFEPRPPLPSPSYRHQDFVVGESESSEQSSDA